MASASFKALVQKLGNILRTQSHEKLPSLLNSYTSNKHDWACYTREDMNPNSKYTRNNLLCLPDNLGQILILVWKPHCGSSIHNHPKSECWVKLLQGEMEEVVYNNVPKKLGQRQILENEITHINDEIGMHSMHNRSPDKRVVSLHIYSRIASCRGKSSAEEANLPSLPIYKDFQKEFI